MRSRFTLKTAPSVVLAALLLSVPATLLAQEGRGVFVTPIPGAPFTATVMVERSVNQMNGPPMRFSGSREIARDGQGRIYNEVRPLAPASVAAVSPVTLIHIYDPQSRMSAFLYPQQKIYQATIVNRPPRTDTVEDFASPAAQNAPQSEFTRQEDLGYRSVAGMQAHGVRVIQTLPAAESGTGAEVVVTDEYWYSEELRINLRTTHEDPRVGSVTMTIGQIRRAEPPASLFVVPADYKMAGIVARAK